MVLWMASIGSPVLHQISRNSGNLLQSDISTYLSSFELRRFCFVCILTYVILEPRTPAHILPEVLWTLF